MARKPSKPYSEYTEQDWTRYFNLFQFRGLSGDEKERVRRNLTEGTQVVEVEDDSKLLNPSAALNPTLQNAYLKEVKEVLGAVKDAGNIAVMRPLVEDYVFARFMLRRAMQEAVAKKTLDGKDLRAIKDFSEGLRGMIDALGQTVREQRLSGRKTESTISELLSRSVNAAEEMRLVKDERIQQAEGKYANRELPAIEQEVEEDVEAVVD